MDQLLVAQIVREQAYVSAQATTRWASQVLFEIVTSSKAYEAKRNDIDVWTAQLAGYQQAEIAALRAVIDAYKARQVR